MNQRLKQLEADIVRRYEWPDPTPIAPPVGYKKQPSMVEIIREQVRVAMSQTAQEHGFETFEESDDFNVDDDFDPHSPYEADFEPPTADILAAITPQADPGAAPAVPPAPAPAPSPTPPPPVQDPSAAS